MLIHRLLRLAPVLLLPLPALALTQVAEVDSSPDKVEPPAAVEAADSVEPAEPAESEEAVTTPEADATSEPAAEQADAPAVVESGAVLDYEPTESISEDLSVSFPVDI